MRRGNNERGSALVMVIAITFIVLLIGVAFYQLAQILGGGREVQNAIDAGILNVNKMAIKSPSIAFSESSAFQKAFKVGLTTDQSSSGINLGLYNRMVSTALLIALNASADGNETALDNANKVLSELQGSSSNSIGGKLKQELEKQDGEQWAKKYFDQTCQANNVRMLGKDGSRLEWDNSLFKAEYLETDAKTDIGATNIPIGSLLENMPLVYDAQGLSSKRLSLPDEDMLKTKDGGDTYLRGYQGIKIPKISRPLFGVPVQPKQQPHLVSLHKLQDDKAPVPGAADGVFVPPNAFKGGAKATGADKALASVAAGIVGMPGDPTPNEASLPFGYLVIDNSLTTTLNAKILSPDNWEANEAGTGTWVGLPSGAFTRGGLYKGQPYNPITQGYDPKAGPPLFDDEGDCLIYDRDGNPVTDRAKAELLVPPIPQGCVQCTHANSDPNGDNPDPNCVSHAIPSGPDYLSPFNRAWHPEANTGSGDGSRNLIAAEQAKYYVRTLWGPTYNAGNVGSFNRNFGRTGLRLYPGGKLPVLGGPYTYAPEHCQVPRVDFDQAPLVTPYSDPAVPAKITTDGTIEELFKQITDQDTGGKIFPYLRWDGSNGPRTISTREKTTPAEEVKKFIIQRMKEIKPGINEKDPDHDADIQKVLTQKLPLGSMWYVYLATPSDQKSPFVVSQTPPPWSYALKPDGNAHVFSTSYPISQDGGPDIMLDTAYDFRIHMKPFVYNHVNAQAVDMATYQAGSGATGVLGQITFKQFVQASGNLQMQ